MDAAFNRRLWSIADGLQLRARLMASKQEHSRRLLGRVKPLQSAGSRHEPADSASESGARRR